MKLLSLLTNTTLLLILQQLISIWFLVDFFLARDSANMHTLWKSKQDQPRLPSQIQNLVHLVKNKHCPNGVLGEPLFNKVVIVVIDALGADFIPTIREHNGSHKFDKKDVEQPTMPFLEQSISRGEAMAFIAKATTPTVTMPRIKALTSGTIPSFVDIIYNLASDVSKFEDDNILEIARTHNKTLVFYGDDTWLSLFNRSMFKRYRETFSFFASDYTTVDTNVTEQVISEVEKTTIDWDYLILHYLGLDHIGHVFGSNKHKLIRTKLLEMDQVIRKIYNEMKQRDDKTLVVICGDHGMTKEGNHGGGSELEANTAMVFLAINRYPAAIVRERVVTTSRQIDFATTLSLLTGMPIPKMSKGVALDQLIISFWTGKDEFKITCAGLENLIQLASLIDHDELRSSPENLAIIHLLESHYTMNDSYIETADKYFTLSRQIQNQLLESIASRSNPTSIIITLIIVTLLTVLAVRRLSVRLLLPVIGKYERLACIFAFVIPIMMHGSTDFIEFEFYFWPTYSSIIIFIFTTIAVCTNHPTVDNFDQLKVGLFISTFLLTAVWNNVKLSQVDSSMFTATSLIILFNSIRQKSDIKTYKNSLVAGVCILIMLSKSIEESPEFDHLDYLIYKVVVQEVAMVAVILHTLLNILSTPKSDNFGSSVLIYKLATGWISIAFLLSRRYNFVFLISSVIMETSFNSIANSLRLSLTTRTILYLNFAYTSFYNQGNSNSFSSIDIRPAFYGQTSYNIYLSIPLVLAATFSTQIYWIMKLLQRVQEANANKKCPELLKETRLADKQDSESVMVYVGDLVVFRNFLSLSYYMFVCLVLRNHLFIWSVISPKLLCHFVSNNVLLVTVKLISNIHKLRLPLNAAGAMEDKEQVD